MPVAPTTRLSALDPPRVESAAELHPGGGHGQRQPERDREAAAADQAQHGAANAAKDRHLAEIAYAAVT